MKRLNELPLSYSAPILLTLPVLVVAGALSVISHWQGRAAANQLAWQNMGQVHDQIRGHVCDLLQHPQRIVALNTSLLRRGVLSPDDAGQWRDTLVDQSQAFGMLSAITWGGEDGQSTWIARYRGDEEQVFYAIKDRHADKLMVQYPLHPDGQVDEEQESSFEFDPRVRPWYRAPVAADQPTWSEPFVWVGGSDGKQPTLGIAFGRPYKDGSGKLVGVVDADLSLQDVSIFLSELQIATNGKAFIMDRQGKLIASSTGAPLVDGSKKRFLATHSTVPYIQTAAQAISQKGMALAELSGNEQFSVDVSGAAELVMASPLSLPSGIEWVIVTSVPQTDFSAPLVAGQRRALLFAGLALLTTIALGVWLSHLMIQPMLALVDHARRIGSGDLEGKIELDQSPELRLLSQEINQMVEGLRDRLRLRASIALAMEVQQNLLPDDTPVVKGLDIAGHSTYCDETGGDYYDYLEVTGLSDEAAAIAIGDVMGHGIAAAMLMANARGILRSHALQAHGLGELLTHLNDLLVQDTRGMRFMTMLLIIVDSGRRELRWASAGHDPPIVYDPNRDVFLELGGGGLPLGLIEDQVYQEEAVTEVDQGWLIVTATDGLWETRNIAGEMYGRNRLRESIRRHASLDAQAISDRLREELQDFLAGTAHDDDITFVVVRVTRIDAFQEQAVGAHLTSNQGDLLDYGGCGSETPQEVPSEPAI